MTTDVEFEAIIRERLRFHPHLRCQCDACVLSRILDEARAESAGRLAALNDTRERAAAKIAKLTAKLQEWDKRFDLFWEAHQRGHEAWRKAHPGNDLVIPDMAKMVEWIVGALDRLSAPTGADAMERAKATIADAIRHANYSPDEEDAHIQIYMSFLETECARAIEQAEAAKDHVWNETVKAEVSAAQREARAQMREEAADLVSSFFDVARTADIVNAIRALSDDPPQ